MGVEALGVGAAVARGIGDSKIQVLASGAGGFHQGGTKYINL